VQPKMLSTALALILLLPATSTASAFAGSATSQSDAEAVAIAKALAELEGRRAEVAALKEVVKAKDTHIAALERLIEQQTKIIAEWRTAAEARAVANDVDARLEASYQESVKRYEAELARVREERDSARRSRFTWAAVALVVGAVVGFVAARD
jgi:hypothetical protein